jgi:hypothetical protein
VRVKSQLCQYMHVVWQARSCGCVTSVSRGWCYCGSTVLRWWLRAECKFRTVGQRGRFAHELIMI